MNGNRRYVIICRVMKNWLNSIVRFGCGGMKRLRTVDWLAPLAIRLYLVPVFWVAGTNKWHPERGLEFTARFFDRLGYPLPELMAFPGHVRPKSSARSPFCWVWPPVSRVSR